MAPSEYCGKPEFRVNSVGEWLTAGSDTEMAHWEKWSFFPGCFLSHFRDSHWAEQDFFQLPGAICSRDLTLPLSSEVLGQFPGVGPITSLRPSGIDADF